MKKYLLFTAFIFAAVCFLQPETFGQRTKLAQAGMKFLSAPTDARATGMGESFTAVTSNSAALFYNPATMAFGDTKGDVSAGVNKWIADINYVYSSFSFQPSDPAWGKFGASVMAVNYGDLLMTVVDGSTERGYRDVGTFSPTAIAIGVGYANALSEKFSVGGQVKYVRQNLGVSPITFDNTGKMVTEENSLSTLAFDFGIFYKTGFKSLNFGMSVRNFSTEIKYKEDGFQLPLNFKIGVAMDLIDLIPDLAKQHSFLLAVDVSHPRDYPEQLYVGGEYNFMKWVYLRGGVSFPNDEKKYSLGFGLKPQLEGIKMAIDYAYTPFGIFSSVHNFTVRFEY
ncbi:PorV/PorQ family protein [Ignavibacteriales bacterium]